MYRSILVPLDGSPMAEQALVPAGDIARRLHGSLALAVVHPWGPREDAPFAGTEADRELREQELAYLQQLRERSTETFHVPVRAALLEGDPAEALAGFAAEQRTDLVVSSTHGRGPVARALRGAIALRLAHAVACPALLLKPLAEGPVTPDPDGFVRVLVPLDGSAAAEAALEPALALAGARGVVLTLLRVVSPLEALAELRTRRRDAFAYLNRVAERLEIPGVRVECKVMTRGHPAAAIVAAASPRSTDLVAITTRDRGEGERMLLGSVADRVVHMARVPVLVCHGRKRNEAGKPRWAALAEAR